MCPFGGGLSWCAHNKYVGVVVELIQPSVVIIHVYYCASERLK